MVIMMCGRFYIEADDFKDILDKQLVTILAMKKNETFNN